MLNYFVHLWAGPPTDLLLSCPAPTDGQPPDLQGFYDILTVNGAFTRVVLVQSLLVCVLVTVCYSMSRYSTGSAFIKRWWTFLGVNVVLTAIATWVSLRAYQTRALAGSCETNPDAFRIGLPTEMIEQRTIAGAVWSIGAFVILSLILTQVLGRVPTKGNGFFHNRGCPYPRILP